MGFQIGLNHSKKFSNALFLGIIMQFSLSASTEAQTLPELPRVYIDTTYSAPTGATCTAATSSQFQNCLNSADLNSTIVLQAGTTYTGNFTLPNKTSGSGWIYIVSSNLASLPPPGTRVRPSDAVNMPLLTVNNSQPIIDANSGAHHYRFVGIAITTTAYNYNHVLLGNGSNNIVFDRCYLYGRAVEGSRRGLAFNGTYQSVIDSYLTNFAEARGGSQGQAVAGWAGGGPFKIVNNFLQGGMSVLFGGDNAPGTTVPSDIEIRRNTLYKPANYTQSYVSMNALELKNSQRVLIEGNLIDCNNDCGGHGWSMILRCAAGSVDPHVRCENITLRNNHFKDIYGFLDIMGRDDEGGENPAQRILVENNLVENIRDRGAMVLGGGPGWSNNITFNHNTLLMQVYSYGCFAIYNGSTDYLTWTNNICLKGGVVSEYSVAGAFANLLPNVTFTANVMQGASSSGFPSGNFFPSTISGIGFVNYQVNDGNYRLSPSSPYKNAGTDGKDLGADIDAIEAAMSGTGAPPPTTLPSPSNLTIIQ